MQRFILMTLKNLGIWPEKLTSGSNEKGWLDILFKEYWPQQRFVPGTTANIMLLKNTRYCLSAHGILHEMNEWTACKSASTYVRLSNSWPRQWWYETKKAFFTGRHLEKFLFNVTLNQLDA